MEPIADDGAFLLARVDGGLVPLNIKSKKLMDEQVLADNVRKNVAANYPRFFDRPDILKIKGEPIALIAGGPSLNQTIERAKAFKHVMVAGSAHDHVVRCGIEPTYAVMTDGIASSVDYLTYPQKNCTYLFASQIDPKCFERVKAAGAKINMWHYGGQIGDDLDIDANEYFNNERTISWAAAVTLNSMQLCLLLGYQHIHLFGFDCAHIGDQHHAYEMTDWAPGPSLKPFFADVGEDGTQVWTDMGLVLQAAQFMQIVRSSDGNFMQFTVHGPGLVREMVRQGNDELKKRVALEP